MSVYIVVNGRYAFRRVTGVERYAREVVERLKPPIRLVQPSREVHGLAGHLWEQLSLPRQLDSDSVLWSPANTGPLSVPRQIVTVHDCSPLDHPEWFRSSFAVWYRYLLPKLVRRVRRVITDSEFSRQRLLEFCCVPEERVCSIPCGVDTEHFYPRSSQEVDRVRSKYGVSGDYIFMAGSLDPRKNFQTLFQAWEILARDRGEITLVIAGGRGIAFREMKLNGFPDSIKVLGYVEERALAPLYSGALLCINPSLYEGFGLSTLEAMACGTPVIASNTSALPELVGEAGLLVDPYDAESLAAAIVFLLSDGETRKRLSQQGLERARIYSWEYTAEQVLNTIEQVKDEI